MSAPRIVILGAGATGLGAAVRLAELGHAGFHVYERDSVPGGLAASVRDDRGFTWDLGGHVLDSHFRYFDRFLDRFLGDRSVTHERRASIWIEERLVPYPIQYHLSHLSPERRQECLDDLVALERTPTLSAEHFGDWLYATFGPTLSDLFMVPYNEKVWASPVSQLDAGWVAHRVPRISLDDVVANATTGKPVASWGPTKIRYPRAGGTGAIWERVAASIGAERISYGTEVVGVDADRRRVKLSDGGEDEYDYLVSTIPLDHLMGWVDDPALTALRPKLRRTSTCIVGVGLSGPLSEQLAGVSWLYFPQPELPFHRVVMLARFSARNVPDAKRHWSLMAEVSSPPDATYQPQDAIAATVRGFQACGLISARNAIESTWARCLDYGYPTPFLGRDTVLHAIHPVLAKHNIFSRGRFGGWKFEVSDQDHSVMQGVEIVNRMLFGVPEATYWFPEVVNSSRFRLAQ